MLHPVALYMVIQSV